MARVCVAVESNQIRSKQAAQDVFPPGQHAKQLGGGKGDVQEEANPCFWKRLANHERKQHQVIIVYPKQVTGFG